MKEENWSKPISHHPTVETHTYPTGGSPGFTPDAALSTYTPTHSMYYYEEYFTGFVMGMSTSYPLTISPGSADY